MDKETHALVAEKIQTCVTAIREIEDILSRKKITFRILGTLLTKIYEAKTRWGFQDPA